MCGKRIAILVLLTAAWAACGQTTVAPRGEDATATADPPAAEGNQLRIYALADKDLSGRHAAKMYLEKIDLAGEPLLTSDHIVWYDWRTCRIFLKAKDLSRIRKAVGLAARQGRTVPVVVVVGEQRRFLAGIALESPSGRQVLNVAADADAAGDAADRITTVPLLRPWDESDSRGQRDDSTFLEALRCAGRLGPAVLARPRMTRDQAVAAARKMKLPFGKPDAAPADTRKVTSVTFCREAGMAVPSENILGFAGPALVYQCWIVQFEPEGKAAHRRWPPTACVVDDRTGATTAIFPPAHVAALPVPGTDLVPMKPWYGEKEVREAAGKLLKEVASVEFVESIEYRAAEPKTGEHPIWSTMRYVWACRGKDGAEVILSDAFRRGPRPVVGSAVRTRRKVLPLAPDSPEALAVEAGTWTAWTPVNNGLQFRVKTLRGTMDEKHPYLPAIFEIRNVSKDVLAILDPSKKMEGVYVSMIFTPFVVKGEKWCFPPGLRRPLKPMPEMYSFLKPGETISANSGVLCDLPKGRHAVYFRVPRGWRWIHLPTGWAKEDFDRISAKAWVAEPGDAAIGPVWVTQQRDVTSSFWEYTPQLKDKVPQTQSAT